MTDLRGAFVLLVLIGVAMGSCGVKVGEAGCGYLRAHVRWETAR